MEDTMTLSCSCCCVTDDNDDKKAIANAKVSARQQCVCEGPCEEIYFKSTQAI